MFELEILGRVSTQNTAVFNLSNSFYRKIKANCFFFCELFQLQDYVEYMGSDARVLLVPSIRDANHDHVFPQVLRLLYAQRFFFSVLSSTVYAFIYIFMYVTFKSESFFMQPAFEIQSSNLGRQVHDQQLDLLLKGVFQCFAVRNLCNFFVIEPDYKSHESWHFQSKSGELFTSVNSELLQPLVNA